MYLHFNRFQTRIIFRNFNIFRFQNFYFQKISIYWFQHILLSTNFNKFNSTYFNVYQRVISTLLQGNFGLKYVEICKFIFNVISTPGFADGGGGMEGTTLSRCCAALLSANPSPLQLRCWQLRRDLSAPDLWPSGRATARDALCRGLDPCRRRPQGVAVDFESI